MGRDMGRKHGQRNRGEIVSAMRAIHRLSAVKVTTLKQPGHYADGGNLYLRSPRAARRVGSSASGLRAETAMPALVRFRRSVSFGAQRQRRLPATRRGRHRPDRVAQARSRAARIASAKATTFEQCAKAFIASHEAGWRTASTAPMALDAADYVYPVIGALPVQAVDTALVLKVLEPIWTEKPETASRVRGRIEAVLELGQGARLSRGREPGALARPSRPIAPAKRRCAVSRTMPALPYRDIGTLMGKLRAETTRSRALSSS